MAENLEPDEGLLQIEGEIQAEPPIEKVRDYYATTVGGLEDVALRDLKTQLKALSNVRVEKGSRHGRLFFSYERSPRLLLSLRSVQNVFTLLGEIRGVTPGRPGLLRLARGVAEADLVPSVALHDTLHGAKQAPWVALSCTSGRGHRFSASELRQVVQTVLWDKYEIPDRGDGPPYRLHLHVDGRRGLLGMQVPVRRLQDRDWSSESPAAGRLDATLAYCMALLGRVEGRDVCLDPACGDGGLLLEAGQAFGPRVLIGGDGDPQALASAQGTASAAGQPLLAAAMAVEALPLRRHSVDKVLCDLRRRWRVPGEAEAALGRWLVGFAHALRPGRAAVVLVDDARAADRVLAGACRFTQLQRVPVHLSGQRAWICVLKRDR